MKNDHEFEVIIIGGSYAGLSAALALGRALRWVLVIDDDTACNRQTPLSHNFLTHDGEPPKEISAAARQQVEKYETVRFYSGRAVAGNSTSAGFEITTEAGDHFRAEKLIFASGIKDLMPPIKGFAECWGISVLHCPYCHGYEVKNEVTGIIGNGDTLFEFSKLIDHWTKELTLFTNGPSTLTSEQKEKVHKHGINIIEEVITSLEHTNGMVHTLVFSNGTTAHVSVLYARIPFVQHCDIPTQLGCELTETGHLKVDAFNKTTVHGVFACGDNATLMRSVSTAVAMGTLAGAAANSEMIVEAFG